MGHHSLKVPRAAGGLRALGSRRRLQREAETEREEEKQRWAEIGCTAGGQMGKEFVKKKKQEKKAQGFSLGCDTQIPKVQAARMRKPMMKGWM